jgi:hypothetical protein
MNSGGRVEMSSRVGSDGQKARPSLSAENQMQGKLIRWLIGSEIIRTDWFWLAAGGGEDETILVRQCNENVFYQRPDL